MIMVRICNRRSVGKFGGSLSELSDKNCWMDLMPNVVSMLVEIDVASAEKSKASPGMDKVFRSLIISAESLTKDLRLGRRLLSL
jgi:hypothetical protein